MSTARPAAMCALYQGSTWLAPCVALVMTNLIPAALSRSMSTAPSHLLMSTPGGPSGATLASPPTLRSLPEAGRVTAANATVEPATGDVAGASGAGVGAGRVVGAGVGSGVG